MLPGGTHRPGREEQMSKSRYPGIERLSSGRYRVRVTWNDPKTGKRKDQKKVIAATSMAEASSWMRGKVPKPGTTLEMSAVAKLPVTTELS